MPNEAAAHPPRSGSGSWPAVRSKATSTRPRGAPGSCASRYGSRYLRFERFETSNGPDLHVYLSAAPAGGDGDAFDDSYVELGELKGNIGPQNYAIPTDLRLGDYRSAVVWCKRFSVAFAAAPLD